MNAPPKGSIEVFFDQQHLMYAVSSVRQVRFQVDSARDLFSCDFVV
jgi:hypothetical protein